ncbi:platelet glycoprotein VI-like [Macrotis lagotis]|uniref:platelet glycoprotein VI-like n=1 Tax=Macrotis lagotis TaxID=92651 RepID=UPI003D69F3D0
MTPTLCALLYLGLCLGQRIRTHTDRLPKPFLRVDKGHLGPEGRSVTFRCQGPWWTVVYRLEKDLESETIKIMDVESSGEGQFLIENVTVKDAGTYSCLYEHSSGWSEHSNPLQLLVTGLHDPPSLSALPSSQVASGQQVTLQCHSERWYERFALYKDGEEISYSLAQPHGREVQTNFSIQAVTPAHGGTYRCYSFDSNKPYWWSAPSSPLVLRVKGERAPALPVVPAS